MRAALDEGLNLVAMRGLFVWVVTFAINIAGFLSRLPYAPELRLRSLKNRGASFYPIG